MPLRHFQMEFDMSVSSSSKEPRSVVWLTRFVEFPAVLCGLLLMGAACLVTVEVILRKLFNFSLSGGHELSGYVLAISTAWGFALALMHRAHIRIDVLYQKLSLRMRAMLDVASLMALSFLASLLTHYCWSVLATTLRRGSTANTPLQTPLWIPQSLWYAGLVAFNILAIVLLVIAVRDMLRRDWTAINTYAGVKSADDELDEALHEAGHAAENRVGDEAGKPL